MADIKDEILKIAIARMQRVGIRSVSVDDICNELGISKKTFYVHFDSKEALLEQILRCKEEELKKGLEHLVAHKTVVQTMTDWMTIANKADKTTTENPPWLYDLHKYYPAISAQHEKMVDNIFENFLVQFLQKGINENIFRQELDANLTAVLFVNVHKSLILKKNKENISYKQAQYMGMHSMDILMRGVLTPNGMQLMKSESEKLKKINSIFKV